MKAPDKIYLPKEEIEERKPWIETSYDPNWDECYIRKDALLEWLDGKMTIEGATEGFIGGYDTALKDVKYKVELLSDEAEKDPELTWEDIQRIVEIADDILLDPQRPRQLSTTKEVYYTEVLKRFKEGQK